LNIAVDYFVGFRKGSWFVMVLSYLFLFTHGKTPDIGK